ncbi:hypothetical protein WME91_09220 [Sorangium sp. So ce269]
MQSTDPLGTGQGIGAPKRPPRNPGTRPATAPPHLDRHTKDAVGRALMHGVARVKAYLRRRGLPSGDVEDFAFECACLTYRNIADGSLALCADPAEREGQIGGYMRTMAWRMVSNRKRFKDVFRRHDREGGETLLEARTYEVEPALELASEIRAEPPKAQRFLLAMLGVGGALRFAHEAAVDAGMHKRAGKWALQRCRARAAKRLATV